MPETSFNFFFISDGLSLSDSILIKFTFSSFDIPPCVKASSNDL